MPDEFFISLVLFVVGAGLAFCVIGLPIIALVRTRRIVKLAERLERLEAQVQRLGQGQRGSAPGNPPVAAEADILAELTTRLERLERKVETGRAPVQRSPAEPGARVPRPAQAVEEPIVLETVRREQPAELAVDAAAVEAWIGRQGLGWVAVVLLLFATAFFLKYAFENRWIGELGRVALGVLAGSGLAVLGCVYHGRGWRVFSQMLTAGGIMLLFLSTFGAFGYYHLIPRERAAVFLIALVAETAGLAVLYEAPAIAIMAVVGGLLNPLLLSTGHDQYASLFTYLLVLNAGAVGITLFRRWPAVCSVSLAGTQLLFWQWYVTFYHPEKLGAALLFQSLLFVLFVGQTANSHSWRAWQAIIEELVRLMANAVLFAAALYTLLDEDYHVWMGAVMIALADVYAALGWLLIRRPTFDRRLLFVIMATAIGFVATAIPLQADAAWIAVGWAVQGAVLWHFALRLRLPALRNLAAIPLVLAVGRLVFIDTPWADREPFIPLFNTFALPAVVVSLCLFAAAASSQCFLRLTDPGDRAGLLLTGLAGVVVLWFILSVETYSYFTAQIMPSGANAAGLERSAQTGLSVAWAAYAAAVLGCGFALRSDALRWAALGLFGLTLGKVFVVDLAALPGLYRVLAFFVLALMSGIAAWAYHKSQHAGPPTAEEVVSHETV